MFTGIVEELGTVVSLEGPRLRIGASVVLEDVEMGASIAVNGCCLTVVGWSTDAEPATTGGHSDWWDADMIPEPFSRTSLGSFRPGEPGEPGATRPAG